MTQMPQQQKQVTLGLTVNQLNTIMLGLSKLPIEIGLETFEIVNLQAKEQLGAPGQQQMPQGPLGNKVMQ